MACQVQRRRFVRVRTPTDGKHRDAKPHTCVSVGVFDESSIWRHRRRQLLSWRDHSQRRLELQDHPAGEPARPAWPAPTLWEPGRTQQWRL